MSEAISQPAVEMTGMRPVQPKERIVVADILRGFSLLGVLMMNMHVFAGDYAPYQSLGPINQAVWLFTRFFAQAKFYTLFSFLFGWGMAIQLRRAEERGAGFISVYVRRLLVLMLIGLIHAILIWNGDILNNYALLGFFLLLFRKRSDKFILVAVAICLLIPVLISTPGPAADFTTSYNELTQDYRTAVQVAGPPDVVLSTGTYLEAVEIRLLQLRAGYAGILYWGTHVLGMFLLGLYVGRRKILTNISEHLPLFRKVMWWGLIVGLPLNALWVGQTAGLIQVPPEYQALAIRGARTIAGSALSMAYVSIIVLLTRQRIWLDRLASLAPLGRTALSNYLMHSLIFTMVFYGYGLGLYGRTLANPLACLILTFVLYSIQVSLSRWWMERYLYGPMEWVWRSLTYGKLQPMIPEWRRQTKQAMAQWTEKK